MVTVPSFLLRRLYVKGSLRNTEHGVQFELLNKLGAGYARKLLPLAVDGREVPMENCFFSTDGTQVPFDTVSDQNPFTLDLNSTTVVTINNISLTNEPHKIGMAFQVPGLGMLQFDFVDVPSHE